MKFWHHLKKVWALPLYYADFLEKCYRKNLLWSFVEDQGRIMEALAQFLSHLEPTREKLKSLSQAVEKLEQQKNRDEALLLSSLQRSAELERRLAGLQKQVLGLSEEHRRLMEALVPEPPALPEIELLAHLYEVLPCRTALDIGAHQGTVSARLLERGFRVHAFEPNPELYSALVSRFQGQESFQAHAVAVGEKDGEGELHLLLNPGADSLFPDPTLYSTLHCHPLPPGLEFGRKIPVVVRSLDSLHQSKTIPEEIGLIKIDTEGQDARVLAGMGNRVYDIVMAEFWSADSVFGSKEGKNLLREMAGLMKKRGYLRNIVLSCKDGEYGFSYLLNAENSPEKSWGNVLFFQKEAQYLYALEWCRKNIPRE